MHTGISTQENLSHILRAVSQRRRHGVLEILSGERRLHIQFVQGKIVDVVEHGEVPAQAVVRSLQAAELLPPNFTSNFPNYASAWSSIQNDPDVVEDVAEIVFKRAIRHRALSKLFSLDFEAPVMSSFDASMVEYERDFTPSISIGQLLLDLVALQADRPKFVALCSPKAILSRGQSAPPNDLVVEEELLYELLAQPQTISDLRRHSLLSEFSFQDAFLRMHEHGLIVFQEARDGKEDFLDEQLLNDLDSAIDDVFEEEGFSVRKEEHPASRVEAALQAALEPQLQIRETVSIDVAAARSGIRQRIAIASTQALQNYWIPALIMAIFLICVGVIPLYLWQGAFEVFAG